MTKRNASPFHPAESIWVGNASRAPTRCEAGLLLIFQSGKLRFEGHPWVLAQTCRRSRVVGRSKNWKMALPPQNSPVQGRAICHLAHSSAIFRKRFQEECGSQLQRAIPANRSSEKRVPEALCGAWYLFRGNSHLPRPAHPLAGNVERRKEARRPAPPAEPRASPDSQLVAAISRFELASPLASFYYATPALRSRQPDLRPAFRRANASIAVAVRVSSPTTFPANERYR
jgi:hypothetical protein